MFREAGKPRYFYIGHLDDASVTHRVRLTPEGEVEVQSVVRTGIDINRLPSEISVEEVAVALQEFDDSYTDATASVSEDKLLLVGWKPVEDDQTVSKAVDIALGRFPDFAQEYKKSR